MGASAEYPASEVSSVGQAGGDDEAGCTSEGDGQASPQAGAKGRAPEATWGAPAQARQQPHSNGSGGGGAGPLLPSIRPGAGLGVVGQAQGPAHAPAAVQQGRMRGAGFASTATGAVGAAAVAGRR